MKVSFLLCAYNEENTIEDTMRSLLNQSVKPDEIIVVNDGSTDDTFKILRKYEDKCKIINIEKNTGSKAKAQMMGLKHVTGGILAFTDADTLLDPCFVEKALPFFTDPSVGGVSGYVVSKKKNWLTAVRQIQYLVFQGLFKKGMAELDSIMVIPGCAGLVRTKLFRPSFDTITEDMDMTLTINEKGYRIIYTPDIKAYTNDPTNLKSYIKQITRWYSGYFQNLKKHFGISPFRVILQATIPIFENLLTLSAAFVLLVAFVTSLDFLIYPFLFELLVVNAFVVYGVLVHGRKDLLTHIPAYFLVRTIELLVWLKCVVNELILGNKESRWLRAER